MHHRSSLTISLLVSLNEGYFRFSHLLMYFLCRFTIIFLKSSLNHEKHILSDICVNILKLVVWYVLFPFKFDFLIIYKLICFLIFVYLFTYK